MHARDKRERNMVCHVRAGGVARACSYDSMSKATHVVQQKLASRSGISIYDKTWLDMQLDRHRLGFWAEQ